MSSADALSEKELANKEAREVASTARNGNTRNCRLPCLGEEWLWRVRSSTPVGTREEST